MCEKCEISRLVYDPVYHNLAVRTHSILSSIEIASSPKFDDIEKFDTGVAAKANFEDGQSPQIWPVSENDVAYLHHTSGTSTGLPKPIPQSHHAAVGVLPSLCHGEDKATFTTTPLYHGGIADCFRAWTSGALIWLFPGREIPITAANILRSLECAQRAEKSGNSPKVQYFSSVPYVLQMMAVEIKGLQKLRQMEIVGVGGAALPQNIGDDLVQQDINLISRFGSAECGFLMSSHRHYAKDKDWQYLRSRQLLHLNFEPQENGLAELVIQSLWPHMAKRNRDDGSYATADLFESHPRISHAWKYHSRADSQLTLATGKKFDPAPLESAIASSPLLKDVLIFGTGEQYPGALLFRSNEASDMDIEELLQALWPQVEKLNSESQSHARLSKGMLKIMPTEAAGLEKSSKGSIMRGAVERLYSATISRAYEEDLGDAAKASHDDGHPGAVADEAIPESIADIVKAIVGHNDSIPKDADLYSLGVDSVACMRIRALLQSRLLPTNAVKLPLNVVYDCGSTERLAQYILALRKGKGFEKENEIGQMSEYVSQYGAFKDLSKAPTSTSNPPNAEQVNLGETVVLTGATGALGAHILSLLRSSPLVSKIHCLVRAASLEAAHERVSKSLRSRRKGLLDEDSTSKVYCHPCKLSDPGLGLVPFSTDANELSKDLYNDLARRTTVIIHAAWAVNFSMRLSSFVKDHIAGLQNLINFALASPNPTPPKFFFCSSTASVLGPKASSPVSERISHDPLSASPLGYSRSKWVAEGICEQAHLSTRLRGRISVVRIGQLCGDTENGIWNMSEAWPLMLSSVKVTGSLPELQENLDWLPVDLAAEAVVENALSNTGNNVPSKGTSIDIPVLHILNSNPQTKWSDLLHWLQKLSPGFKIIPPADWVEELEGLEGAAAEHPARKLLGLWKGAYTTNEDVEGQGKVAFDMEKTKIAISVMRDVQPINEAHFEKIWAWIEQQARDR